MSHLQRNCPHGKSVKNPPVCPNVFYKILKMSIAKRLLDDEDYSPK
jgi:hypothetical protein